MKYTAFSLLMAALVASAPVYAQSSSRGSKARQEQSEDQEAKTGVRFVICSAQNIKVKSPLWYKVSDEEAKKVTISSRTATPRIKPKGGKVVFYESDPIPPKTEEGKKDGKKGGKAEKWQEPKVVFSVDTKGAASKSFCIVIPETETQVETIMLSESEFPKKGVHLINLSKKDIKIVTSTSENGDFKNAKPTLLKGGNTKGVNSENKWSFAGAGHGEQVAFKISYVGVKEQRTKENGKYVKKKVKDDIPVRSSKFIVSERQSFISIIVDDPKRDGVQLLSIQLAE